MTTKPQLESTNEKENNMIKTFMQLFSGRTDVYGINQLCLKEPPTKDIYKGHLTGAKRIGIYPIYDKIKTNWFACDIDEENFNKALSIKTRAAEMNLLMHIERSKSKGYHVWIFFSSPTEAVKPRLVFESILEELNINCEIFPKQDEVFENQYGNFIFLPLFGGDVKNGKTIFVDDKNQPLIDKIDDIDKITLTDPQELDNIIVLKEFLRLTLPVVQHLGSKD